MLLASAGRGLTLPARERAQRLLAMGAAHGQLGRERTTDGRPVNVAEEAALHLCVQLHTSLPRRLAKGQAGDRCGD